MLGKVTVIWRPNVGKSSFFNMYTGHKIAIVADEAGTTRDIIEFEYNDRDNDIVYIISDSGWLDFGSKTDEVAVDIIERTIRAIDESDMLLWLIEYDKFTDLDEEILRTIRKKKYQNVVIVATKADNEKKEMEAYSLAWKGWIDNFFVVSTSHNRWINDIKNFIADNFKSRGLHYAYDETDDTFIKLAMIGRPNVGKSSLVNAITRENRVMVKDMAGTTRDSVDTKFVFKDETTSEEGQNFVLIDTAGIRRASKIGTRNIEDWSIMRTDRSISRADVVAVVIDGFDGIVHQDMAIIEKALEEGKWIIVVVNKWDKVLAKPGINKDTIMNKYIDYLRQKIEFMSWVSVIFVSATEWKRVDEILKRAIEIKEERQKRIKTGIFNTFLEQVIYKHPPTGNKKSHKPKIYYGSQVDINPPKFVVSVNNPEHFHFSYKRYLENRIRDNFWYAGTPISIEFKWRGKTKDIVK